MFGKPLTQSFAINVISTAFLSEIRDMEKPRERGCFAIFEVSLHGRLIKGIRTEPGKLLINRSVKYKQARGEIKCSKKGDKARQPGFPALRRGQRDPGNEVQSR